MTILALMAVVSAALCYQVTGFILKTNLRNVGATTRAQALCARGFSRDGIDPKLGKEASKCLKDSLGNIEVAQSSYFQTRLLSLKKNDPSLFKVLESYKPQNAYSDESARQAHEKLVEYTWDTIAAYLPLTSTGAGAVEPAVSKKLDVIAQAVCFQTNASVMDVGCGNGVIVPHLRRAGADLKSYLGIDLSTEMVDCAKQSYPGLAFAKTNFLTCTLAKKFDAVLFNGVVQFFPSIPDALRRAALMLKPGGRLVIAHVNGAGFVRGERRGNPNTVLADMPDVTHIKAVADEIGAQFIGLEEIAPHANYSTEDDMYLCALQL